MRIGIDLRGVIDTMPEHFKWWMKTLKDIGVNIVIVSGPPLAQLREELDDLGIKVGTHYSRRPCKFILYNPPG
jgi:soluble P-type ATPase